MAEATRANITAHLYQNLALEPVACNYAGAVRLWQALNNEPARPIAVGQPRTATLSGRTVTVWDFNDVDVSAARNPGNRLHFFVTVDGVESRRNIWTHGADARTLAAQLDIPTGTTATIPPAIDAKIEILWPHNGDAVTVANKANLTTFLFARDTLNALASTVRPQPVARLYAAVDNNVDGGKAQTPSGTTRAYSANGLSWLAYDFNDIDVRAANDPAHRIYFWTEVDGIATYPNIWTHGAGGITIAPSQDVPSRSCR